MRYEDSITISLFVPRRRAQLGVCVSTVILSLRRVRVIRQVLVVVQSVYGEDEKFDWKSVEPITRGYII